MPATNLDREANGDVKAHLRPTEGWDLLHLSIEITHHLLGSAETGWYSSIRMQDTIFTRVSQRRLDRVVCWRFCSSFHFLRVIVHLVAIGCSIRGITNQRLSLRRLSALPPV